MEQTVKLARVLPETLEAGWPVVAGLLAPAVERARGEATLESLARDVLEGRMQLWLALKEGSVLAAMLTELMEYNSIRVCEIRFLGGAEMDLWTPLLPEIEDWALTNECVKLRAQVRAGLARKLRSEGFEETHRVIVKSLRGRLQ